MESDSITPIDQNSPHAILIDKLIRLLHGTQVKYPYFYYYYHAKCVNCYFIILRTLILQVSHILCRVT